MGLLQSSQVKANLFIGCQPDCAEGLHIARKLVLLRSPGGLGAGREREPNKGCEGRVAYRDPVNRPTFRLDEPELGCHDCRDHGCACPAGAGTPQKCQSAIDRSFRQLPGGFSFPGRRPVYSESAMGVKKEAPDSMWRDTSFDRERELERNKWDCERKLDQLQHQVLALQLRVETNEYQRQVENRTTRKLQNARLAAAVQLRAHPTPASVLPSIPITLKRVAPLPPPPPPPTAPPRTGASATRVGAIGLGALALGAKREAIKRQVRALERLKNNPQELAPYLSDLEYNSYNAAMANYARRLNQD